MQTSNFEYTMGQRSDADTVKRTDKDAFKFASVSCERKADEPTAFTFESKPCEIKPDEVDEEGIPTSITSKIPNMCKGARPLPAGLGAQGKLLDAKLGKSTRRKSNKPSKRNMQVNKKSKATDKKPRATVSKRPRATVNKRPKVDGSPSVLDLIIGCSKCKYNDRGCARCEARKLYPRGMWGGE